MNLTTYKSKLKVRHSPTTLFGLRGTYIVLQGAKKGYDLLKKKADALKVRNKSFVPTSAED